MRLLTSGFSLKHYSGLLFPDFLAQSASYYFIMHLFDAFALQNCLLLTLMPVALHIVLTEDEDRTPS